MFIPFSILLIQIKSTGYQINSLQTVFQLLMGLSSVFVGQSSIGAGIEPFQDGHHGSKMAAMAPRWPPWLQDGRHHLEGRTGEASGVCHALDHGRNGFGPEC